MIPDPNRPRFEVHSHPLVPALVSMLLCALAAGPSAAQGRAYYWGDPTVNGDNRVSRLDPPSTTTQLALGAMDGGLGIDGVGVSPGGSLIAVAGTDASGVNGVLNVYGPFGGAPLATLHAGDADDDYSDITFSPDSMWVAFLSDLDFEGSFALYVVPSGGGTVKRVSQTPVSTATDVSGYAWANDSKYIAFVGDPVSSAVNSIWVADVTVPIPTPVELPTLTADPDVRPAIAFDSTDRIYFISDFEVDGLFRLYRANSNGSGLEHVPGTSLSNGLEADIGTLGISPDGTRIAFSADAPSATLFQVYTMVLSGSTPVLVSNVMTTPDASERGPTTFEPISWSPDGAHLAVAADWNPGDGSLDNDLSAFVLPVVAPAGGVRVLAVPSGANQDVAQIEFASNTSLVLLGDLVLNNDTELYRTSNFTTMDQDPNALLIQDVVAGGDVLAFVVLPEPRAKPEPLILSITDVGNDQGRQVSIEWRASGLDTPGSPTPILEYALFRRIDPALALAVAAEQVSLQSAQLTGWHYVLSVPAFAESIYAVVAPTLGDSTVNEGLYNTTFVVRAATAVPWMFFDSAPDSGYSVDDLAPGVPMNLVFGGPDVLVWAPPAEADFAYHTVYGSPTQELGAATVIGNTIDPTFDVTATPSAYYLVTTTDHSGNEGPPAVLADAGTVSAEAAAPGAFAFVSAHPNPFRSASVITFELPAATRVDVRVFEPGGRAIREILSSRFAPGRHSTVWDGRDDAGRRAAPGVYFVQIRAGAARSSRSVVLVR